MAKSKQLICPSGLKVTIRETTGADDDIFSGASAKDYSMINSFISRIIIDSDMGKLSTSKVEDLYLADKYFILISSRIFSLGPILYFTHTWEGMSSPTEYDVNLEDYIWDYTQPFPELGSPKYFDQRIRPYPPSDSGWLTTTVGDKEIKFHFLDGHGEIYLLNLAPQERTINKQLVARNLQVKVGESWEPVKNFGYFSAREMVQIRSFVDKNDPEVQGLVYIVNPMTGEEQPIPILGITDFFFPTKI